MQVRGDLSCQEMIMLVVMRFHRCSARRRWLIAKQGPDILLDFGREWPGLKVAMVLEMMLLLLVFVLSRNYRQGGMKARIGELKCTVHLEQGTEAVKGHH